MKGSTSAHNNLNRIPNVSVEHAKYFYYVAEGYFHEYTTEMMMLPPSAFSLENHSKLKVLIQFVCALIFWKYFILVVVVIIVDVFFHFAATVAANSKVLRKVHWVNVRLDLQICKEF